MRWVQGPLLSATHPVSGLGGTRLGEEGVAACPPGTKLGIAWWHHLPLRRSWLGSGGEVTTAVVVIAAFICNCLVGQPGGGGLQCGRSFL